MKYKVSLLDIIVGMIALVIIIPVMLVVIGVAWYIIISVLLTLII